MRTEASTELTPVDYHLRPDGVAEVRLHRNIVHDTSEGDSGDGVALNRWTADEVELTTTLSQAEVAERFDDLWTQAERDGMTDRELIVGLTQRVGEGELTMDELADALIELAGMIGGE